VANGGQGVLFSEPVRRFFLTSGSSAKQKLVPVTSEEYFGKSYQDILARVPAIEQAHRLLGWRPTTDLRTAIRLTLDFHLSRNDLELG